MNKETVNKETELENEAIKYSDRINHEGETSFSIAEAFEAGAKSEAAKKYHQLENIGIPLDKLLHAIDEYVLEQKNHQLTRTPERMSTIECVAHWCKKMAISLNKQKRESDAVSSINFLKWIISNHSKEFKEKGFTDKRFLELHQIFKQKN